MGFSKPPGVPCPPNNPHCHGDVPSVTIQSDILAIILAVAIFAYVFCIFRNRIKKQKL